MFDAIRNVMDSVPFPVFVLDDDAIYRYQNPMAAEAIGYRQDEIEGRHLTDVLASEPEGVLEEFERIKTTGCFSGPVLYKMRRGGLYRGDANVFLQTLSKGCMVVVSMVMPAARGAGQSPVVQTDAFDLSANEVRLLQLLSVGLSDRQIAEVINSSADNLHYALEGTFAKMGVASRTQAVIVALKSRIIL